MILFEDVVGSGENDVSDEVLVLRSHHGDQDAVARLYQRYRALIRKIAATYYLPGADRDDLWQEGMIGLYKAICDFQPDKHIPFPAFARVCITRHLISVVKTSTRQKHALLNASLSLEKSYGDECNILSLVDLVKARSSDTPEGNVLEREAWREFQLFLQRELSQLEYDVLRLYVDGWSYEQISYSRGISLKAVDNALQRIRRKLTARWIHENSLLSRIYA